MVNCAGDMVAGFSGSGATNYISALYTWHLGNGVTLSQPRIFQAGTTNSIATRWGDFSATTLDPTDDWTFWTVQEYAAALQSIGGSLVNEWKTAIAGIRAGP